MGTRHMIGIIKDGTWVLGQHGQWDGYLEGQGERIVDFFLNHYNKAKFAEGLKHVTFPDDEYWKTKDKEIDLNWDETYPWLSRDCGANVWGIIQNLTEDVPFVDNHEFAENALFCEWAYVFDMDNDELEVYCCHDYKYMPVISKKSRFENKKQKLIAVKKISQLTENTIQEIKESLDKDPLLGAAEKAIK